MATDQIVQAVPVKARPIAAVKFHARIADLGAHMGPAFGATSGYLQRQGLPLRGPSVALYRPTAKGEFDVAAGFPVEQPIAGDGTVVPVDLPAGEAAVTTYIGAYEGLPAVYEAVLSWIRAQGREPGDLMWEEYFSEPTAPPEQTRTDVYWLLKAV